MLGLILVLTFVLSGFQQLDYAYDGHFSFAAERAITAPFKSGDIIVREFASSKGTIEMAAETVIDGRTLHLKDIAVYPRGAKAFELGTREIMALRDQLAAQAREMGFDTLRITGKRLTGANPGKLVDVTIDLTK
jgi:hypothetical protein